MATKSNSLIVVVLVVGALTVGPFSAPAMAAERTFVVNSADDPGTGHCTPVSCTLRQAIDAANQHPASDNAKFTNRIAFNIPGAGAHTIALQSALPSLTNPVIIDGTTEPGYAGSPLVVVDGTSAGPDTHGLVLAAGGSTVRALVLERFGGSGVFIGSDSNTVAGNFIGTNVSGTAAAGNGDRGVRIEGGSSNVIGGLAATDRNVISGNANQGVFLTGSASSNAILGNFIGTDAAGTTAIANGGSGVIIADGTGNTVGGTALGARNVISGNGIQGVGLGGSAPGNAIQGNYVGVDVTGTMPLGNGFAGVAIFGAPGTLIGGTSAGAGNVISGNHMNGIFITGAAASGTRIQGNRIGTNAAGDAAVANTFNAVTLDGAPNNTIGGSEPGAGNLLSGSGHSGVFITGPGASGNLILRNLVGTNAAGTARVANGAAGVALFAPDNRVIGNLISGNGFAGIWLAPPSARTVVQGNHIGTNAAGSGPLGNSGSGILADGSANSVIGGTNAAAGNLISGNGFPTPGGAISGVTIRGAGSSGNVLQGNRIGTNAAGNDRVPNNFAGVDISDGAHDNLIGGIAAGAGNLLSGNGNPANPTPGRDGVRIIGAGTIGNRIEGNFIGTDATGTAQLGNTEGGVRLEGASGNTIGGTAAGAGNVISGNGSGDGGFGVHLVAGASSNQVLGNFIGTDASGTAAVPNADAGVFVDFAPNNTVGGTALGARNVISGGLQSGIAIRASGTVVQGNYIGTDVTGTQPLGNRAGINMVDAANNTIGGAAAGARNVISGNTRYGVRIFGALSTGNHVEGNYIGVNTFGTGALGNALDGVFVTAGASGNVIGGTSPAARNVISANLGFAGVELNGSGGTLVQGNYIGPDVNGNPGLTQFNGVAIFQSGGNTIGGTDPGAGNVIAFNTNIGVGVLGLHNRVLGNSIYANRFGLGIDLFSSPFSGGAGPTPNDPGDADSGGGNDLQNFPVITSAVTSAAGSLVAGTLNSTPNTVGYRIEFFASASCNAAAPFNYGEGQTFLGFTTVSTDPSGNVSFAVVLPPTAPGSAITATATDPNGDTSEFSQCVAATP